MDKLPKGIKIEEVQSVIKIEAKNYDETLLLMQIILMLLPLLAINVYLLSGLSLGLLLTLPLLGALIYWIVYNIKDNYLISISDESLEIVKGMNKKQIVNLPLTAIKEIGIIRKHGKVLTSGRTGLT
jgi:hypothetical protein